MKRLLKVGEAREAYKDRGVCSSILNTYGDRREDMARQIDDGL